MKNFIDKSLFVHGLNSEHGILLVLRNLKVIINNLSNDKRQYGNNQGSTKNICVKNGVWAKRF